MCFAAIVILLTSFMDLLVNQPTHPSHFSANCTMIIKPSSAYNTNAPSIRQIIGFNIDPLTQPQVESQRPQQIIGHDDDTNDEAVPSHECIQPPHDHLYPTPSSTSPQPRSSAPPAFSALRELLLSSSSTSTTTTTTTSSSSQDHNTTIVQYSKLAATSTVIITCENQAPILPPVLHRTIAHAEFPILQQGSSYSTAACLPDPCQSLHKATNPCLNHHISSNYGFPQRHKHAPINRSLFTFDLAYITSSRPEAPAAMSDVAQFSVHFLQSCHRCKRHLLQGRDIFMYKGDKAFCSLECRYHHIARKKQ